MTTKTPTAAAAVAKLAGEQHGVISRDRLRKLGIGDSAIEHAIRAGHLHRVFRGVYAVGHLGIGQRGRMRAASARLR